MGKQRVLLLVALILFSVKLPAEQAKVYKWVDAQGITHYSEDPPETGKSTPLDLNHNTLSILPSDRPAILDQAKRLEAIRKAQTRTNPRTQNPQPRPAAKTRSKTPQAAPDSNHRSDDQSPPATTRHNLPEYGFPYTYPYPLLHPPAIIVRPDPHEAPRRTGEGIKLKRLDRRSPNPVTGSAARQAK